MPFALAELARENGRSRQKPIVIYRNVRCARCELRRRGGRVGRGDSVFYIGLLLDGGVVLIRG